MIHTSPNLRMQFLLKVDDSFIREVEIASNILMLEDAVNRRKIDLSTTEGAISIIYYGEELLGVEYWDEINIPIDSITSQLPQLFNGQAIRRFLPLNSCWLSLTPQRDWVVYKLESASQQRTLDMARLLPLHDFVCEFELLFWRMVRIMARLGSTPSMVTVSNWRRIVEGGKWVNETDVLQWVIEQPLEVVLAERSSRN